MIPVIALSFTTMKTTQTPAVAEHDSSTPNTNRTKLVDVSRGGTGDI